MTEQIRPLESLTREELIKLIRQEREAIGAGGVSLMSDAKDAEIARLREALDELANGYAGTGWDIGLVQRIKKARAALAQEQS